MMELSQPCSNSSFRIGEILERPKDLEKHSMLGRLVRCPVTLSDTEYYDNDIRVKMVLCPFNLFYFFKWCKIIK